MLVLFAGVAIVTGWWYQQTPTGFLPTEDQGYVMIAVQLPDGASLDRTREVIDKMNKVFAKHKERGGVENWFVLGGFSMLDGTTAPNGATAFAAWTDWSKRTTPELQQEALVRDIQIELASMQEAFTLVLVPPAIQGLGFAGGFQMQIEDRDGVGSDVLMERTQAVIAEAQ